MRRKRLIEDWYFEWLCNKVGHNRYAKETSFSELFRTLHSIDFRYIIPKDENRAADGIDLRERFMDEENIIEPYPHVYDGYISGPCSVLEMMVALAIRCEEDMADNPAKGDRTSQWFWQMIVNLGLGSMMNSRFDREYVEYVIDRFLDREYEPDGTGGLFKIKDCEDDLRDVEIWMQLCWYLDE